MSDLRLLLNIIRLFAFVCLINLFCTGCSQVEVVSSVDAKQSVELLVLFDRAGIFAERKAISSSGKERYRIMVDSHNYSRALHVMHELQLPRAAENEIEKLTKQKGFMPQAQALVAIKYDIIQALKVERQIEALPGVLDARVAIHTPVVKGNIIDDHISRKPRASVVIRHIPGTVELPFSAETVKEIIALAVPNLNPEQVALEAVPLDFDSLLVEEKGASAHALWPFSFGIPASKMDEAKRQVWSLVLGGWIVGALVGSFIIFLILWQYWRKKFLAVSYSQGGRRDRISDAKRSLRKDTLSFNSNSIKGIDPK